MKWTKIARHQPRNQSGVTKVKAEETVSRLTEILSTNTVDEHR